MRPGKTPFDHPPPPPSLAYGSVTGLEISRYVSLQSKKVNLRVGPGTQYAIRWAYVRADIPLEIIAEYGT